MEEKLAYYHISKGQELTPELYAAAIKAVAERNAQYREKIERAFDQLYAGKGHEHGLIEEAHEEPANPFQKAREEGIKAPMTEDEVDEFIATVRKERRSGRE